MPECRLFPRSTEPIYSLYYCVDGFHVGGRKDDVGPFRHITVTECDWTCWEKPVIDSGEMPAAKVRRLRGMLSANKPSTP
mgnify:CR=1 FL=1